MKISVYITSYNQKQYLIEAVESALAQTLKPHQIIIADDCSHDGSQEVIAGFHSQYPDLIVPLYHTQNTGVSQVRTDALQLVSGDYVTYIDGDDRFLPTKLEKEAKILSNNPDIQIAFSNHSYITENGNYLWTWVDGSQPPEGNVFRQIFARDFPRRNLFRMETVNYNAWKNIGFYDPNLQLYEDYEARIRLTKQLRAGYCNETLSEHRYHKIGLSSLAFDRHLKAINYIYQKNKYLLDDLSWSERYEVEQKFGQWAARVAGFAAEEAINRRQQLEAIKFLLTAYRYDSVNWRLHAQVFASIFFQFYRKQLTRPLFHVAPYLKNKVDIGPALRTAPWGIEVATVRSLNKLGYKGKLAERKISLVWLGRGEAQGVQGILLAMEELSIRINLEVLPGPGRKDTSRTIEFTLVTPTDKQTFLHQFDEPTLITFPIKLCLGQNKFSVKVLEEATVLKQPNGDTRPLLVLLHQISLSPSPDLTKPLLTSSQG